MSVWKPEDLLAPNFSMDVGSTALNIGVLQLVEAIEYESADGMADALKVTLKNPDFILTEVKAFQPGNDIHVWMGYGTNLVHIGGAVIVKTNPQFPQDGYPTIEITAYTRDHLMMDKAPEGSKGKGKSKKKDRAFADSKYSDAVKIRAEAYDFNLDVDDTPSPPTDFVQKAGMSDYEFVKGLSNLTGFIFWVDADENGKWTLHFKDPTKPLYQEKENTYIYNRGNDGNLLSFSPELLISGYQTKIAVSCKNIKTGKVMEATFEETNDQSPETLAEGTPTDTIKDEYTTASDVKLYIEDYAFDCVCNKTFKTEAELVQWAQQWYRRQRENFIMSSGLLIGDPILRANQIHILNGLGKAFDGKYYFTKVKHRQDATSGYTCEFNARKYVPEM
jgi:phage protein D